MKLTCSDLVQRIKNLPKDRYYTYISGKNSIKILRIEVPEGPIIVQRTTSTKSKEETISTNMLWRVANAFREGCPINIDRILGASYNTRSALETLLAYTPEFHTCRPHRIEEQGLLEPKFVKGHKYIIWLPMQPHANGLLNTVETDVVISETQQQDTYYNNIQLEDNASTITNKIDIAIDRRHAQIQVALVLIGKQLGFRTWVAQNDKGIIYNNERICNIDSVITSLQQENLMLGHPKAAQAAKLIDCLWFKNGRLMPAVMEIEHSTGVTSGLERMKNFQGYFPPFPTRYTIVAPDELRNKVIHEANKEHFKSLQCKFFPYSAVEELYNLCERRKIRGVNEEFLDSFMEDIVLEDHLIVKSS